MWPFSTLLKKPPDADSRSYVDLSAFTSFSDINMSGNTTAGVPVTQTTALTLPVVFSCVRINTEVPATMPVDVIRRNGEQRELRPSPWWLERPNDDQDWTDFISQAFASRWVDGNAFILKSTSGGNLTGMWVLDPSKVTPRRIKRGRELVTVYDIKQSDGSVTQVGPEGVMHIKSLTMPGQLRSMSPITQLAETMGVALAAQQYGAAWFGSGAHLTGIIEAPKEMNAQQTERLKADFTKKHAGLRKSHALGILSGGATWKPLSVSAEESQFLDTIKVNSSMIAHAYGVPAEWVTETNNGAAGYVTSLHLGNMRWLQAGLNPTLVRFERAFSSLLPRGTEIRFNRNSLMQMDPKDRIQFYANGLVGRYMTPDDVRALEDMSPLPGGSDALWSVQWQHPDAIANLSKPDPAPVPATEPPDDPDEDPEDEPAEAGLPVKEDAQ